MKLVVGIVGAIASGKGVVSDHLAGKYGAKVYRFSDVLRDLLLRLNKPDTRENLQSLGLHLRQIFGDNVLAEVLKKDIEKEKHDIIIVDGLRYWNEVEMIRGFKNNLVISVTAPVEARYERAVVRATRGEAKITLEDFKRNENRETERLIDEISLKADIRIENTGSREELLAKVEAALKGRIPRENP